jgi:2-polyprenyl-3-methyl-5-hydroxy-6-metoxy-1,4-benzoquinol methylase
MTSVLSPHRPRHEGEQAWLHHLPRARVVSDRGGWLVDRARGRTVAHLGFADTGCELTRGNDGSWLHARLAPVSLGLVGLDVDREAVDEARSAGFEAYAVDCTGVRDVERLGLGQFDVVLLGELIEHVDDSGALLDAAATLMAPDGILVVTTPNARRLMDVLLAAVGREIVHPDHVAIYSARTLVGALERRGFAVVELLTYMNPRAGRRPWSLKELLLTLGLEFQRALATTVSPYLADGLIAVARPRGRAALKERSDAL